VAFEVGEEMGDPGLSKERRKKSSAWWLEWMTDLLAISTGTLGWARWTLDMTLEWRSCVDMQLAEEPESPMALMLIDDDVEGPGCGGMTLKHCLRTCGSDFLSGGTFILFLLPKLFGSPLS